MTTLAGSFQTRFRAEFPEYARNVCFVEYLPPETAALFTKPPLTQSLKYLFGLAAASADITIYETVKKSLPGVPDKFLEDIFQNMVSGESGCFHFPSLNNPENVGKSTYIYDRSVVVGPDKSRTIADLTSHSFFNSEFLPAFPKENDTFLDGMRAFHYHHETAHALHMRQEYANAPEFFRDRIRLRKAAQNTSFPFEDVEQNFKERVADIYATFRVAGMGLDCVARTVAAYRISATSSAETIDHFTTPAILRALKNIRENPTSYATPQDLFQRALGLARKCPLRPEEIPAPSQLRSIMLHIL